MTNKEFVKTICPNAKCIKFIECGKIKFDIVESEITVPLECHFIISDYSTSATAWKNAKKYIEEKILRTLND